MAKNVLLTNGALLFAAAATMVCGLQPSLACAAASTTAATTTSSTSSTSTSSPPAPTTDSSSTSTTTQSRQTQSFILAAAMGLTPPILAALDAPTSTTSQLVANLDPSSAEGSQFLTSLQTHTDARAKLTAMLKTARKNPTAANLAAYNAAKAAFDTTGATMAAAKHTLAKAVTRDLTSAQQSQLIRLRQVQAQDLPLEFAAVALTSTQFRQLKLDIQEERADQNAGKPVSNDVASRLATLRANAAVQAMKQRYQDRLSSAQTTLLAAGTTPPSSTTSAPSSQTSP